MSSFTNREINRIDVKPVSPYKSASNSLQLNGPIFFRGATVHTQVSVAISPVHRVPEHTLSTKIAERIAREVEIYTK